MKPKTKDEIREWLDRECSVNNYGGAISVERVVEVVARFQQEFMTQ